MICCFKLKNSPPKVCGKKHNAHACKMIRIHAASYRILVLLLTNESNSGINSKLTIPYTSDSNYKVAHIYKYIDQMKSDNTFTIETSTKNIAKLMTAMEKANLKTDNVN